MTEIAHYLVLVDNGQCLSQARFTIDSRIENQVHVLASMGATKYVDMPLSIEDARDMYEDLRAQGWVVPFKTRMLTAREIRRIIHD